GALRITGGLSLTPVRCTSTKLSTHAVSPRLSPCQGSSRPLRLASKQALVKYDSDLGASKERGKPQAASVEKAFSRPSPLTPCPYFSISSPISSAGAECVIAPTEMRSTPVNAIERTVSSVTPPDASSAVLPLRPA